MANYDIRIDSDGKVVLSTITPASLAKYFQYALIKEIELSSTLLGNEGILVKLDTKVVLPQKLFRIDLFDDFEIKKVKTSIEEIKSLFENDDKIFEGLIHDNRLMLVIGSDYEKILDKYCDMYPDMANAYDIK